MTVPYSQISLFKTKLVLLAFKLFIQTEKYGYMSVICLKMELTIEMYECDFFIQFITSIKNMTIYTLFLMKK